MNTEIETMRELTIGRVTLKVASHYDEDPDYSWLGKWCSWRQTNYDDAVYSCRENVIRMPGSELWRDKRGRIVEEPELDDRYAREYQFIKLSDNYIESGKPIKHALRYWFQDAEQLEQMNNQQWCFIGIVATVRVDGREVGNASCWGFESDSGDKYLQGEARSIAREALADARAFIKSLTLADELHDKYAPTQ